MSAAGHRASTTTRALAWAAASIATWAVVDSSWSMIAGGSFNVVMVNAPACALTLLPLAWAWWGSRSGTPFDIAHGRAQS